MSSPITSIAEAENAVSEPLSGKQPEAEIRSWPLQVQLRKKRIQRGLWDADSWSLSGCISDRNEGDRKVLSVVEKAVEQAVEQQVEQVVELVVDDVCTDYLWSGLALELFRDERVAYRFNLSSSDPRLFVICSEEEGLMRPYVLTVSQDVASSYMDGGEEDVYSIAMPEAIQCWIEGFIGRHGEPEMDAGKSKRRHHGKRNSSDQSPIPDATPVVRGEHV